MSSTTLEANTSSLRAGTNAAAGRFGLFGGRYVAETLMPALVELEAAYAQAKEDEGFQAMLSQWLHSYAGRPSPLYRAARVSEDLGGASVWFKRDELNHTGSHKINNCIGQVLLARHMGKRRLIAETGAGQHGVAVATLAARLGMKCRVYMGAEDCRRQRPNLLRMEMLGAEVYPVTNGRATLKEAMNEALREWAASVRDTYYVIGTAAGPHPYPTMVRDFQAVIGHEVKQQFHSEVGKLPDALVACIGGGSNAIGLFHPFVEDEAVKLFGVEAAGKGIETSEHCASLSAGAPGILHGNLTKLLQDGDGQVLEGYSISAGLDYPGVGPEHAWLQSIGRAEYVSVTDSEAVEAFAYCARNEGILPALEPSHALAFVRRYAPTRPRHEHIVMNLCGRGDKDLSTVAQAMNLGAGDEGV